MKIVVLAGGLSGERNVSLSSGTLVAQALLERGHRVALCDLFFGLEGFSGTLEELYDAPVPEEWKKVSREAPDIAAIRGQRRDTSDSLFGEGVIDLCRTADIVFLALHGDCGEDGRLQAALAMHGIPFTGSDYLSSAIAMDKDLTKKLVAPVGVLTPAWECVSYTAAEIDAILARTKLPCVVKPVSCGSSIGVSIARTEEEFRAAMELGLRFGARCVLEQYIEGREIQIAVLEGRALPSIEIIPRQGFYDYENKYQPGAAEEICPSPIPAEWEARIAEAALKVFETVGLSVYARADFIVTAEGEPYFIEINNLPGMTPTSLVPQEAAAVGISYGELCERIVNASLRARKGL
ncbi:MAG: D-alanine--D-alanine ligase [Oscillospiraceae bacterium]|nr:D-alanine--D-alanine ligase [Oscillospiraceae bacterium]